MDKRTKAQLLEQLTYTEQTIRSFSAKNKDTIDALTNQLTNYSLTNNKLENQISRLEKEVIRCNDLIHATTQENNRLTIERNAANALVDRIRIPSEMNISTRDMQTLLDKLNSEVIAALLLVKG